MATFKVGQRVRIIGLSPDDERYPGLKPLLGAEGVILRASNRIIGNWIVDVPTVSFPAQTPQGLPPTQFSIASERLRPLTDPKADEFIERVKKWKPEPEIVAPKQPVNVA